MRAKIADVRHHHVSKDHFSTSWARAWQRGHLISTPSSRSRLISAMSLGMSSRTRSAPIFRFPGALKMYSIRFSSCRVMASPILLPLLSSKVSPHELLVGCVVGVGLAGASAGLEIGASLPERLVALLMLSLLAGLAVAHLSSPSESGARIAGTRRLRSTSLGASNRTPQPKRLRRAKSSSRADGLAVSMRSMNRSGFWLCTPPREATCHVPGPAKDERNGAEPRRATMTCSVLPRQPPPSPGPRLHHVSSVEGLNPHSRTHS